MFSAVLTVPASPGLLSRLEHRDDIGGCLACAEVHGHDRAADDEQFDRAVLLRGRHGSRPVRVASVRLMTKEL
ncbi:MAG: hypothetical protein NT062_11075 [Proteobacteria bacterium]|nr:hypothetical protein [Pseudomonadota bacterium]